MQSNMLVPFTSQALAQQSAFVVRQKKEWGEIITGWDTKNRYEICDQAGQPLLFAGEVGGSFVSRGFLGNMRPFTIEVKEPGGGTLLTVRRPWRWFLPRAEIYDSTGKLLGAIQRRFTFLRRRYEIEDAGGQVRGELLGPILKPWTFEIHIGGTPQGKIRKQWSGLMKEAFTKADNFGVELGTGIDDTLRMVCLGATFLIDFVHFERKN